MAVIVPVLVKNAQRSYGSPAFTLVELSIVLVIMGLLAGAVTTGRILFRQAELRAIASEVEQHRNAYNNFVQAYDGKPGDLYNAYDIWGTSCDSTASYCNGNGDNAVTYGTVAQDNESYRYWQHLTLASMIQGKYSGTQLVERALPLSRFKPGSYNVMSTNFYTEATYVYDVLGGVVAANDKPTNALFTPTDAMDLDGKMDDGEPGTGNVRGNVGTANSGTCYTGTVTNLQTYRASDYNLANSGVACTLYFIIGK